MGAGVAVGSGVIVAVGSAVTVALGTGVGVTLVWLRGSRSGLGWFMRPMENSAAPSRITSAAATDSMAPTLRRRADSRAPRRKPRRMASPTQSGVCGKARSKSILFMLVHLPR